MDRLYVEFPRGSADIILRKVMRAAANCDLLVSGADAPRPSGSFGTTRSEARSRIFLSRGPGNTSACDAILRMLKAELYDFLGPPGDRLGVPLQPPRAVVGRAQQRPPLPPE